MILAGLDTGGIVPFPAAPRRLRRMNLRVLLRSMALATAALALSWGLAHAQGQPFNPSENPMSNQGYDAAVITVGTAFNVTRAIYMGSAASCSVTLTTNKGSSVQFQNVQPGEFLPVQATLVSASTCTAGTLLAIF